MLYLVSWDHPRDRALGHRGETPREDALAKIYVGNLPWSATEEEIRDFFSEVGEVSSVTIVVDRETGRSRGFGFVDLETDAIQDAIAKTNGQQLGGRTLRVDQANERPPRPRR